MRREAEIHSLEGYLAENDLFSRREAQIRSLEEHLAMSSVAVRVAPRSSQDSVTKGKSTARRYGHTAREHDTEASRLLHFSPARQAEACASW